MIGKFTTKDGIIFIKGRSVKNKPIEPTVKNVGLSKQKYIRTLVTAYRKINFTDFNIIDLSELSLKQWVNKKYPIPKGHMIHYGRNGTNFKKITQEDMIRNRIH